MGTGGVFSTDLDAQSTCNNVLNAQNPISLQAITLFPSDNFAAKKWAYKQSQREQY